MQPLHDEQGNFAGYVSIETDITAKRDADEQLKAALRLSDGLMRTINTYSIVSETDPAGTITRVNEAFCRISGYAEAELIGASHNIVNSGVHPPSFWAQAWQTISSNQPWRSEVCNQAKDGSFYWVDGMIAPLADENGVIEKYISIRRDITERKKLEQEISERNQLLQNILLNIPVGLSVMDRHLNLVADNPQVRKLMDLPDSLFAGPVTTFESIVRFNAMRGEYGPGDPQTITDARVEWMRHAKAHQFERQRPGGVTVEVRGAPMPGGGFVTSYTDITELRNATEAAEQASRSKSQFLANMSHEIRTPMNAILGMLKLMHGTELSIRQLDYTTKTEGAARSLLGLLNDILDFSKVEAGKMKLDPQPFRLDQLLRDLSVIYSANVGAKPVEVLFDIDPMVPKALVGDAMRLQQVLINLGGNAIKFTERGEVVLKVEVLAREGYDVRLRFAIRDSGIGIAPEHQAHIFDGFSQAEASTTRRYGGTGLGLSICKRLVALMGGELKLDSAPGTGSTFYFTVCLPSVDLTAQELLAQTRTELTPLTTLVIDDNPSARELIAAMVESLGWNVDLADSGAQAIAMCKAKLMQGAFPYQAVFVDWQMPGMDGWQTSRRIRELSAGEPAPIVVMVTAHGREMLTQRNVQEQSLLDAFLVKPVTASMLLEAVVEAKAAFANPGLRQSLKPEARRQRLAGMRLLVVEDNLINQQVAQELLCAEGAQVEIAGNGQLGVHAVALANPVFNAVLMDIQMPVMDGYAATREIRQTLGLSHLPIIAMTANAMPADRQACLDAGMDEHVGKPFELDSLVAVLLRLTGRSAAAPQAGIGPLPDFDQVDVMAALNRLGGNKSLYARTLGSFLQDSETLTQQLSDQLRAALFDDATRLLHTLKGLAATVGATPLSQVAARIESAVRTAPTALAIDDAVAELEHSLASTRGALQEVLAQLAPPCSAPAPSAASTAPPAELRRLTEDLRSLATMLRDSDMSALAALEQMKGTHRAHASQLGSLDDAMAALDFGRAIVQCEDLIMRLTSGDTHAQC
ncbi:MAG: response regulator [Rubrivivax sp.]|nr:response regulator [Rubrivivax sp.]